jgi:hypothetical protein
MPLLVVVIACVEVGTLVEPVLSETKLSGKENTRILTDLNVRLVDIEGVVTIEFDVVGTEEVLGIEFGVKGTEEVLATRLDEGVFAVFVLLSLIEGFVLLLIKNKVVFGLIISSIVVEEAGLVEESITDIVALGGKVRDGVFLLTKLLLDPGKVL